MPDTIPPLIAWAVATVDVGPDDRLLEIGCGRGVAVAIVCERLDRGTILAIDRSAVAIKTAEERNAAHVDAGRATFRRAVFADADLCGARFNKIFAIRVNFFWQDAARELAVIAPALASDGRLFIFYDPPAWARIDSTVKKVRANLEAGGFAIERVLKEELHGKTVLGIVARAG